MKRSLKNYLALAAFVLGIVLVCGVACTVTALWVIRGHGVIEDRDHHWVHEELGLVEGEIPKLEELEEEYAAERNRHIGEMQLRKAELARHLLTKSTMDDEVRASVSAIHESHGKLQELSIQHYFDVFPVLDDAQIRRLRELAAESLAEPPR